MIRWAMIGCGAVTEKKSAPSYQKTEGFALTHVYCRDIDKARDYAARHDIAHFTDEVETILQNPDVDAVYIATPPDSHLHFARLVAEAGKICSIEKPLAPSFAEAKVIVSLFASKNIPLFVSYYRRSLPRFQKVKEWIESGAIGEVRQVRLQMARRATELDRSGTYNWRTDREVAYGGYFDDVASHALDLMHFLFGNIKEASGFSYNQQGLYSAKDAIVGSWMHESGVMGVGSWNYGVNEFEDLVTIEGSLGKIIFHVLSEKPIVLTRNDKEESLHFEDPENIQIYHTQNIHRALSENFQNLSTGETALHTSWVMDRILGKI